MNEEPLPASLDNRTGLIFFIDTHIPDSELPAAVELRALHEQGWIELVKADTVDTELSGASDLEKRTALLEASSPYAEWHGPMVWGQSRWGHSVWTSPEDRERLNRVFKILFPNAPTNPPKQQNLRDAMHVATAIRYGAHAFVTTEKRLFNKREAVQAAFNSFLICTPDNALASAQRAVSRYRQRTGT